MTVREFIYDRLGRIILQIAFLLAVSAFLFATGTQAGIITILLLVCLLVFTLEQLTDFWRSKKRLDELQAIMSGLDQQYLFAECAPKPQTLYERKLFELLRLSGKSMIEAVSDAQAAGREYRDYIERWVHEIKTPITAAKLICQNTDSDIRRRLSQELAQIDAHVERALFYHQRHRAFRNLRGSDSDPQDFADPKRYSDRNRESKGDRLYGQKMGGLHAGTAFAECRPVPWRGPRHHAVV